LSLPGAITSHEPQPRSFNFSEKSRDPTKEEKSSAAAAEPEVFAERLREEFSAAASDGALLQRGVSETGPAVVPMEKPAAVPEVGEWASETPATKRTLPATSAGSNAGGWRRERARVITIGLIKNIFSVIAVIVRAAM